MTEGPELQSAASRTRRWTRALPTTNRSSRRTTTCRSVRREEKHRGDRRDGARHAPRREPSQRCARGKSMTAVAVRQDARDQCRNTPGLSTDQQDARPVGRRRKLRTGRQCGRGRSSINVVKKDHREQTHESQDGSKIVARTS